MVRGPPPGGRHRAAWTGPFRLHPPVLLGTVLLLLLLPAVPATGGVAPTARSSAPRPGTAAPPTVAATPDVRPTAGPAADRTEAPARRLAAPPDLLLNGTETVNLSRSLTVGNLTLEGSSALSFGNASWTATLTVVGSIDLSGHARLTVWDAYFTLASAFSDSQQLAASGNSTVELSDVYMTSGGHDWSAQFSQGANLTVLDTSFGSWCVAGFGGSSSGYFDNSRVEADLQPSGSARLVVVDSASPHLWLAFPNGSTGTLTLPPVEVQTNWSFPAPGTTAGVGVTVRLVRSWPGLFAVSLDPGSRVVLANSSSVDLAFLPTDTNLTLHGLTFGLQRNFTLTTPQFHLVLDNVTVESWSFYAVAARLNLSGSELGEVMGWDGSRIDLTGCTLTDAGGYYAAFDTSGLAIRNSTVTSEIVAYDRASVLVANSTIDAPGNQSVLAVADATVVAVNVTLGPGSAYAAVDGGTVRLLSTVAITTDEAGVPRTGARVSLQTLPAPGTVAASGIVGATGTTVLYVLSGTVTATASVGAFAYLATASVPGAVAESPIGVGGPTQVTLDLGPFVLGSEPANGSTGVATDAAVSLLFAYPMNLSATSPALAVSPAVPFDTAWDTAATGVVLTPLAGWVAGGPLTLTVGPAAATAAGPRLGIPFVAVVEVSGGTAPSAAPQVVSTSPADGAAGVLLDSPITIVFSQTMAPAPTAAAFSIVPAVPAGTLQVTGSALVWTGARWLTAGTSFTVTIGTTALSTAGVALAAPVTLRFTTVAAPEVPAVVAWRPGNGSVLTGPLTTLSILWNVPMDPNSTEAAFALLPDIAGTVTVVGTLLTWKATGAGGAAATTYVAEVGAGARSVSGEPMPGPVWAEFVRTAPGPVPAAGPPPAGFLAPLVLGLVAGAVAATAAAALVVRTGRPFRPRVRQGTAARPSNDPRERVD